MAGRKKSVPGPIKLQMPPLPALVWDGHFWNGSVRLPSWRGFLSRARRSSRASDGTARLVFAHQGAGPPTLPTPEQLAAFTFLLDNHRAIAVTAQRALYRHAREKLARRRFADDDGAARLTNVAGLRKRMGLTYVHVLHNALDGVAYLGLELGCTWDPEHGAGVLFHKKRLIDVGEASASFHEGVAASDARRKDRSRGGGSKRRR